MKPRSILVGFVFALTLVPLLAAEQDQLQLHDRMRKAAVLSALDDTSLRPWHWKVSFTQYDADGKASHPGTLEMWFQDGNMRTTATLGSAKITVLRVGDKLYRANGGDNAIFAALDLQMELLHPIPDAVLDPAFKLTLMSHKAGTVELDCFQLSLISKANDATLMDKQTTFCTEKNSPRLLVSWLSPLSVLRGRISTFQSHEVATAITMRIDNHIILDAKTDSLTSGINDNSLFLTSPDFHAYDEQNPTIEANFYLPILIGNAPVYPEDARWNNAKGSVVFDAVIGKDGHVKSLTPNGKSNPLLQEYARKALKTWVYWPFQINGISMELATRIDVNFALQ